MIWKCLFRPKPNPLPFLILAYTLKKRLEMDSARLLRRNSLVAIALLRIHFPKEPISRVILQTQSLLLIFFTKLQFTLLKLGSFWFYSIKFQNLNLHPLTLGSIWKKKKKSFLISISSLPNTHEWKLNSFLSLWFPTFLYFLSSQPNISLEIVQTCFLNSNMWELNLLQLWY